MPNDLLRVKSLILWSYFVGNPKQTIEGCKWRFAKRNSSKRESLFIIRYKKE